MKVIVNGQPLETPASISVAALLEQLQTGAKRVAVEVNQELVVKNEWAARQLKEGDRVEIVTFVGGG